MSAERRLVLVLAALGVLALVPFVPGPLRALGAVTFLLLAPGLAWVHTLPVNGLVEKAAVAVGLSLAVDVLVAEALMFAGLPGPLPAAAALVGITAAGFVLEARTPAEVAT
jgi:hypothetical protein